MSMPKQSANQRMKAQAEGSVMMALLRCIDAIDSGRSDDARESARTVVRMTFLLNPKLRESR